MPVESSVLQGKHIRLEPLGRHHVTPLAAAAKGDRSLYQWSPVPRDEEDARLYVETALAAQAVGKAIPFATVRIEDDVLIGSTRFFDLENWAWPAGYPRHASTTPDVCEIGYTWLSHSAIRTPANTEAKFLMLTHAFETWKAHRVCLHTDVRNQRSRDAIERIGGKFEGILRSHRMAADFIPRDSARFSIVASEWPEVKQRLQQRLEQR